MAVSERLKKIRIERKFSQNDFAEKLNVSRSTYLLVEKGEREINFKMLEAIKSEFDISADWIMFGENKDSAEEKNDLLFTVISTERQLKILRPYIEELTIIARIKALEPQTPQHILDQKFSNLVTMIYSNVVEKFEEIVNSSNLVDFDLSSIEDTIKKISDNTDVIYKLFYKELEPYIYKRKTDIISDYWENKKDKGRNSTATIFDFDLKSLEY